MPALKRPLLVFLCATIFGVDASAAKPAKPHRKSPAPAKTEPKPEPPSEKPPTEKTEPAETPAPQPAKKVEHPVAVSTLAIEDLAGFAEYPEQIQSIVRKSLELTTLNLRYQFGSSDPKSGGMDCSGTVYKVLHGEGFKDTPRQSDEICRWVMDHAALYRTEYPESFNTPAFSAIKPGDLVFWSGTYETATPRELPISHVMIYLGKRKSDGKPILFGASDGRTYDGQRRNGVSVFDFHIPKRGDKASIYGYGRVPGLLKSAPPAKQTPSSDEAAVPAKAQP